MKQDEYKHPVENILRDALDNLKNIVDIGTVVGDVIKTPNGATIIPISKIMLGYVGGGGEYTETKPKQSRAPFATGSGAGLTVHPIGFLIEENDQIRYVKTDRDDMSQVLKMANDFLHIISKETPNEK